MAVDCRISPGYPPGGCLGLPAAGRDYDSCRKGFDVVFCFSTEIPFILRLMYDGEGAVSYITRNLRKEKSAG